LRPRDTGPAGIYFVETNPDFIGFRVIAFKPLAQSVGCLEEFDFWHGYSRQSSDESMPQTDGKAQTDRRGRVNPTREEKSN